MRARWVRVLLPVAVAAVVAVVVVSARDPAPDLDPPEREPGQATLDLAGVLGDQVRGELEALAGDGWDVVALAYETEQANQGEAQRAGRRLLEAWGADVVLVAVARPGHFTRTDEDRQRFFGVEGAEAFTVPGSTRETITEQVVPGPAGRNDWDEAFAAAAAHLAEELEPGGP